MFGRAVGSDEGKVDVLVVVNCDGFAVGFFLLLGREDKLGIAEEGFLVGELEGFTLDVEVGGNVEGEVVLRFVGIYVNVGAWEGRLLLVKEGSDVEGIQDGLELDGEVLWQYVGDRVGDTVGIEEGFGV